MQSAFYCKRDETILYLNFQFKVLGNVVEDGKTDAKWQHVLFPSEMPQRAYDSMEPFKGDCQGDIDRANTKSVQKAINKYHDMPATRKLHHLVHITLFENLKMSHSTLRVKRATFTIRVVKTS